VLEVKGIADGDVAAGIKGMDPISSGQLTRDEIKRAQEDTDYRLQLAKSKVSMPPVKTKRAPKYTPLSRRHDRPNAILWLLRSHPELRDAQIMRLVGTTKPTIESIRERTHWNSTGLQPQDPVALGLCTRRRPGLPPPRPRPPPASSRPRSRHGAQSYGRPSHQKLRVDRCPATRLTVPVRPLV
jgi:hypothetical protein